MVFVNQDNGLLVEPVHDLLVFQVGDHLLEDKEDVTAAEGSLCCCLHGDCIVLGQLSYPYFLKCSNMEK